MLTLLVLFIQLFTNLKSRNKNAPEVLRSVDIS